MALRRYTKPIDGTIPVQLLLYDDEEIMASQEGVGIYDGLQKSAPHQAGTVHITTHRLFYVDSKHSFSHSFSLDLLNVTQTEYYAGLFKSSSKVTLHLSGSPTSSGSGTNTNLNSNLGTWECEVCAYRNPPSLSPAAALICGLCGVPRASSVAAATSTLSTSSSLIPQHHSTSQSSQQQQQLSSSLPSSALSSSSALLASRSRARSSSTVACPACTFLNHPSLRACEMCSTPLPEVRSSGGGRGMKSAPSSRPSSPDDDEDDDDDGAQPTSRMMKISFRKGGDKAFYAVMKRSLKGKAWESVTQLGQKAGGNDGGGGNMDLTSGAAAIGRSGISGILRNVETAAQGRDTHLSNALLDLEALMVKAKDMVRLAAELNEKLTAVTSSTTVGTTTTTSSSSASALSSTTTLVAPSTEPEEATFIRSSLSQLGLQMSNAPVTLDMIKDERKWIEELARELAQVLQGPPHSNKPGGLMRERGIIALDEVWGGWNRARGVALIPPSTFLLVLPHLPTYTKPTIQTRTFPKSGLQVLHTPPYTQAAIAARLSSFLVMSGPKTTMEIARAESEGLGGGGGGVGAGEGAGAGGAGVGRVKISVGLMAEMIEAVEQAGEICRDDTRSAIVGGGGGGGGGTGGTGGSGTGTGTGSVVEIKWWANLFVGYVWDGQE